MPAEEHQQSAQPAGSTQAPSSVAPYASANEASTIPSSQSRLSLWTATAAGAAILAVGALLTGSTHYVATGKALKDEGLDPTARLKAMPVAVSRLSLQGWLPQRLRRRHSLQQVCLLRNVV